MREEKYFLVQIKRTNGTYEKGVVVKDTLDGARQSYHAYLGAYGYGHDANTDYVACYIFGMRGESYDMMIDDRIPGQEEETEAS
jgi:hypothetical protein